MYVVLSNGGAMVWFILLASMVGVAVFMERLIYYHRSQIAVADFLKGIRNCLKRNNQVEAISICENTPGPVARIAKTTILHSDRNRSDIREAIDAVAIQEDRLLERNLPILWTVVQITPLLGLLGTVIGMVKAFKRIQEEGRLVTATDLAGGIWEALIATGFGLAVAVIGYVAYQFLHARKTDMVRDRDWCATDLINIFAELERVRRKDEFDLSEP